MPTSTATSRCRWRCSGGGKAQGGNPPPPAVLSCLQRQVQADTPLDAAAIGIRKPCIGRNGFGGQKGPFPKPAEMLYEQVETLYEDRELTVIHKPAGLLSVPGKDAAQPSVYALMRRKYPEATGPLIVHRLDMATSGLMIIAKTEFAYHRLQKEFLNHRVQKKYIAIISEKDIPGKEIFGKDIRKGHLGKGDSGKGNHLPSAATRFI